MVSIIQNFDYGTLTDIHSNEWLDYIQKHFYIDNISTIQKALALSQQWCEGLTTFYGQASFMQGLQMAEILLSLRVDNQCVAAAIILPSTYNSTFSYDSVAELLDKDTADLVQNIRKLDLISTQGDFKTVADNFVQIDRLRKLFLAMVSDIRVVLVKLAERICIMRGIKRINPEERRFIAVETMKVYAPLANRLGIGQLKWELEDTAFHYIKPEEYKLIAQLLSEKKIERDNRIQNIISILRNEIAKHHINADVSGRAKHIYSIYNKMQQKKLSYDNIYDRSAFRIVVDKIEDCYTILSMVHALWRPIPVEFDDYIASPKQNGYRSIHTAVTDATNHSFEIQIRTKTMHEEAERGLAAHWVYKENVVTSKSYEEKINFLRQLIDWHKETSSTQIQSDIYDKILNDRVYVFTPASEIIDLPTGATPLDFAYQIHTSVGNRCRGALINDHIVPLTYVLQTGDKVEILTNAKGTPSRDWLNPHFGYIKTSAARAKISHWFRQLEFEKHYEIGKQSFEKEFGKIKNQINLSKLASHFKYKDEKNFLAAFGRGIIKPTQISSTLNQTPAEAKQNKNFSTYTEAETSVHGMKIAGVDDLLTRVALCCKPVPGDKIIGFITLGRGISLHKITCKNIKSFKNNDVNRLIEVTWDSTSAHSYYADLKIKAANDPQILKEITTLVIAEKMHLTNLNSFISQNNQLLISLTLQIHSIAELNSIIEKIKHFNGILEVKRV